MNSAIITCTRLVEFCAGHRVVGHENKCANVHGHNYKVEIFAQADNLDGIGRVIDFSVLKEKVGGWIEKHWDHTFICAAHDELKLTRVIAEINNKPIFVMQKNPTAENMAEFLLKEVCPVVLKGTGVRIVQITVWETPNCHASASF